MKIQHIFTTSHIGDSARQIISQDQAGQVLGVISRGIFLLFSSNKVIFLSYQPYKGPLTLNLRTRSDQLERLSPGMIVQVSSRNLDFDSAHINIQTGEAAIWQAPSPDGTIQSVQAIQQQLVSITRYLLAPKRTSEISSLLPQLIGFSNDSTSKSIETPLFQKLQRLQQALYSRQYDLIATILGSFSGFGAGLTPSGDDLAIGLLLGLNRWRETLVPGMKLEALNNLVVQTAKQKTTSLSANLIECAVKGEADERLIHALDGIMTGKPGPQECANLLLSWGNSSGGDSLVGIALAINLLDSI